MAGLFPFLAAGLPMFQSFHHHSEEMDHAKRAHKQSLEQEQRCHRDSQKLDFLTHHRLVALNKEMARRESARDVWNMRTQRIQNLMLTDTVMLGAGVTLAVEGVPPQDTDRLTLIIYTLMIAFSFCFLLLSMWCVHVMQQRMNQYNVSNNKQLYYCKLGKQEHGTFNEFYKCHCARLNWLAVRMFFLGTIALLLGIFLHLNSKLNGIYGSQMPGVILWSTLFILLFMLTVLRKIFPYRTCVTEEAELKRRSSYALLRPESAPARRTKKRRKKTEQKIQSAPGFWVENSYDADQLKLKVEVASSESCPSAPSSLSSSNSFSRQFASPLSFDIQLNIIESEELYEGTEKLQDRIFSNSPKLASGSSSAFSITNEFHILERKAFTDKNKLRVKPPCEFSKLVEEELPDEVLEQKYGELQFTPSPRQHIGLDRHTKKRLFINEEEALELGEESSLKSSTRKPALLPVPRTIQKM